MRDMETIDLYEICEEYRDNNDIEGMPELGRLKLKVYDVKWSQIGRPQKNGNGLVKELNNHSFNTEIATSHVRSLRINQGLVVGVYKNITLPFHEFDTEITIDPGNSFCELRDKAKIFVEGSAGGLKRASVRHDILKYQFDCKVTCTGKVLFVGDGVQEVSILEIVEACGHYDLISSFKGSRTVNWQMSGVYKFNEDFVQTIRVE
ncbi:uncharacterized protein LOC131935828 isoform X2 [Physella acuta]|uniref:uncharacterized protein LOC131935828 isoform X2 n=1 Tax=Physella acuta TaxID=109671 RepID=UPI0027DE19CC|nr:uncharacterized protein LOC131935828 isoform X2 [Physella acuta]